MISTSGIEVFFVLNRNTGEIKICGIRSCVSALDDAPILATSRYSFVGAPINYYAAGGILPESRGGFYDEASGAVYEIICTVFNVPGVVGPLQGFTPRCTRIKWGEK